MHKLISSLKMLFLWVLYSAIVFSIIFLFRYASEKLWWPTGVRDSALAWVAGDSWAITNDGRFFHEEQGTWKQLDLDPGVPLIWGWGIDGDSLVIVARNGVFYKGITLELPKLDRPIVSAGKINICAPTSYIPDIYVSSLSEIAIYNWSDKSWKVVPLKNPLTMPVVGAGCSLYYMTSNIFHLARFEMPDSYAYNSMTITETEKEISGYGDIIGIASSQKTIWIMTATRKVLKFAGYKSGSLAWEEIASPPALASPHLIAGISGFMFGGDSEEHVDLWLMGAEGAYWYNKEKQDWDEVKIYGKKPTALSGLTTNSETVGDSVNRLAIVDGVLLHQQPIDPTRVIWSLCSLPISGILGIVILLATSFFRQVFGRQQKDQLTTS